MNEKLILPPIVKASEYLHQENVEPGWHVCESRHFRIFHSSKREIAERALKIAEEGKTEAQQKWFPDELPHWPRKFSIRLYPDYKSYSRATGSAAERPAYVNIRTEDARLISGQINLYQDKGDYLSSSLPHEVAHAVVGAHFSKTPRWADEGIAMLSENSKHLKQYRLSLLHYYRQRQLLPLLSVLQLKDYPTDESKRHIFYLQSFSLVSFLSTLSAPKTFIHFIRDTHRQGHPSALKSHYSFNSIEELQNAWITKAVRRIAKG